MVEQRARRDRRRRGRWAVVALLSLLAHVLAFGALVLDNALDPPAPVIVPEAVALRPIAPEEWERRRATRQEPRGQLVQVAPGNGEISPSARFLAETNNRVQRETRARVQTSRPGRPSPPPAPAAPAAPPSPPAPPEPPAPEHRTPNLMPDFKALDLAAMPRPSPPSPAMPSAPPPVPSEPGTAGAFNDDLDQLPEGDDTSLDTREWRYARYFNAMKAAISRHWHPQEVMQATRHVLDPVSRTTQVYFTIDRQGAVRDLRVVRPCGFDPLDEEAVSAIRHAGPFPDPPAALFEEGADTFSYYFTFTLRDFWPVPRR